ncbi:uncharacterized protein G2W53_033565 [Senna tora]|uniref:Uncharacterized protein n=1 Tax=Senna tora TaxID=362788 RepID=A0A834SYR8_9FABA|nr:uncharacterized protein G2W53_033565 [Senna tora]
MCPLMSGLIRYAALLLLVENEGMDREWRSLKDKEARSKRLGGGRDSRHSCPRDPPPLKDQWRVLKAASGTIPSKVAREPPTMPAEKPPLPSTGVVTSSSPTGAPTASTSIPLPRSTEVVDLDFSRNTMEGREEPLNKQARVDSGTSMETGVQVDAPLTAQKGAIANQNLIPRELVVSTTLAAPSSQGLDSGAGTPEEEPPFGFVAFNRLGGEGGLEQEYEH